VEAAYRDTMAEITRIQRRPPPIVPLPFADDTMLTRAWVNDPIHDDVAPMEHHVVAPTLRGDGWSEVRFGTKSICAPSVTGGITIAPRGFGGRFDCDGRPVASNVFVSRERLQRCADAMGWARTAELLPRLNFADPKLFAILALIGAEAREGGPHSRLYLETLLDLLCVQLLRDHSAFSSQTVTSGTGLRPRQVRQVTDYMNVHLDEAVALQQLADLLGLSRFHFCTAFRKATGLTPHQWLVRIRMERAQELLADGRLTVTDVALAVGYQTPSSFTQAFRAAVGFTPSAYRASRQ
jgi:AraC family transcriptional regulator